MDNLTKMDIKALYALGLVHLLVITLNVAAVGVGFTFNVDDLANKVSKELAERRPWYRRIFGSGPEKTVNGIGLVLAFEKRGIDEIVSPSVVNRYTILDLLQQFDQKIAVELVKYRRLSGYKDWNSFSEEDFSHLNSIQARYLDVLPVVLEEKYGKAAKPFVDEIKRTRSEFESRNDGYLLERI